MFFRFFFVLGFLLFASNILSVAGSDGGNAIIKTVLLLACAGFLVGRKIDFRIIFLLGVVLLMIFVLGFLTDYPDFSWSIVFGALNQVIVIYVLLAVRPTAKDRDTLLILAAWLPILCAGLGLLVHVAGIRSAFPLEYNTGQARFAGTLNAAFLSGLCMCGVLASFKLVDLGRTRYYFLMPLQLIILVLAGGRVASLMTFYLSVYAFYGSPQRSFSMKFAGTMVGLVGAAIIGPLAYSVFATRLEASGSSGRDVMWPWLLSLSEKYPDYGIGFGHQFFSTPREVFILFTSNAAHNDYLRLLVELGWFGVFAFYAILTLAVFLVWRSDYCRRDRVSGAPIPPFSRSRSRITCWQHPATS